MTEEAPMSVDQQSIARPPNERDQDPGEANEVRGLLNQLEEWVDIPRIMREAGVTERYRIPVETLRIKASQLETVRLRHRAGLTDGPAYPQSTGTSVHDEDEPNHLAEVMRSVAIKRSENPPLKLDQVAANTSVQKTIQATIDRLQGKIDQTWTPAKVADNNLNVIWEELEIQHWATEDRAKIFVLWVLLNKQMKDALRFQGWVQAYTRGVQTGDASVTTYEVLVAWVRKLKGITTIQRRAESAIHRQEVEMLRGETFQELFRKIWKLGDDAWGPEKDWDHDKRQLLVECMEHATRNHKDKHLLPWHEMQTRTPQFICSKLEILDRQQMERLLHPSLQGGKKLEEKATTASGTTGTKASSGATKATIAMVQDEPERRNPNIKCFNCNELGHIARHCEKPKAPRPQGGRGGKRGQPPRRGGGRDQSKGQPQVQAVDSTPAEETVRSVRHEQVAGEREHWIDGISEVSYDELPIHQAASVGPARAHNFGTHIVLNLQPEGKSKFNSLFGVAAVLDTGQTTGADIVMSENFFKKCIGGVENLSDPPTQGTVSASGGELKAIGSFSARISVDGLSCVKPAEAKIVVYKNLNADLLLGTAFFVRASHEKGGNCLLYTSPSPRDPKTSRMPSSA